MMEWACTAMGLAVDANCAAWVQGFAGLAQAGGAIAAICATAFIALWQPWIERRDARKLAYGAAMLFGEHFADGLARAIEKCRLQRDQQVPIELRKIAEVLTWGQAINLTSLNPRGAKALVELRALAVEALTPEVGGRQIGLSHVASLLDEIGKRVHGARQELAVALGERFF